MSINVKELDRIIGSECYIGVPDSQLKALCNYLMKTYGISEKHIVAANEGNCVGLAAGYHLATGKVPVVYLQNSGIGNIVNPVSSLLNEKVYGIPCVFIVGWRGEPGVKDEPQHVFQGEITIKLLEDIGITTYVLEKDTSVEAVEKQMSIFRELLAKGKSVAFVVKKGALENADKVEYRNGYVLTREEAISEIVEIAGEDIVVSTTGKGSRELFEIRERNQQSHQYDFLTVGSMGHSSSIALGVALQKPQRRVWCIDGDGAVLMHMGAMAVIGSRKPQNMVHIVLNNEAHESVGGVPTVAGSIKLQEMAKACGYEKVYSATTKEELQQVLNVANEIECLQFVEVKVAIGARENLGRPTTTTHDNKENFMNYLQKE